MATPLTADEVSTLLRRLDRRDRQRVVEAARRREAGLADRRLGALARAHARTHRRRLGWLVAVYALLAMSVAARLATGGVGRGALGVIDVALAVLVPVFLVGVTVLLLLHRRAPAPTDEDVLLLRAWLREHRGPRGR